MPKTTTVTHPKPAADAPAEVWEQYINGIIPPDSDASDKEWDKYYQLTEEAADESPANAFEGRVPNVNKDLIGNGGQ